MMKSWIVAWLASAGVACQAAPIPKSVEDQPDYLPTLIGTVSTYQKKTSLGNSYAWTERVVRATKNKNGFRIEVECKEAYRDPDTMVSEVSAKGVSHVEMNGKDLDPPMVVLRLPVRKGETWKWEGPARSIKFTVVGEDEVEVPAGKFKAIRVHEEVQHGKSSVQNENW